MNRNTTLGMLALTALALLAAIGWRGLEADSTPAHIEAATTGVSSKRARLQSDAPLDKPRKRKPVRSEKPNEEERPASLRDLLLEIADAEEAIVEAHGASGGAPDSDELQRLEAALAPITDHSDRYEAVIALLAPGAAGERQLGERETYGAVRAVYWGMVIATGRGNGSSRVLPMLAALPRIHHDVIEQVMQQLERAAADGHPVLDATYLEFVLDLRAMFPEERSLFSRLLEVIGRSMSEDERAAMFSLFDADLEDPVLVGLSLKNLLLGGDPELGILLAGLRFDDVDATREVKDAIANSVVEAADVFAATEFVTLRANELRSDLALWAKLGFREGASAALESEYRALLASNADEMAREMLVTGMAFGPRQPLVEIARNDPDAGVAGQALLSASKSRKSFSRTEHDELNALLQSRLSAGEISSVHAIGAASNLARSARKRGYASGEGDAVNALRSLAASPDATMRDRRRAIDALRPYASTAEIDALLAMLE